MRGRPIRFRLQPGTEIQIRNSKAFQTMKIYPVKAEKKKKVSFRHLTPLQKKTRQVALLLVLVSVFIFFFKILFF